MKRPFNQRDNYTSEAVENDNFYLSKINNSIKLSVTHQYYNQIQTQIHITKGNFCDFLVLRIYSDENLWSKIVSKWNI